MNNKKGGAGAIVVLVLILMLASAVGGAYAYRVFDGKMAVRDAMKAVEKVDISDYDTPEQTVIKNYIDDATKDLQKCQTRKEVYEVLAEFVSDVDKIQTKNEKALEQALKEAEEAKKAYNNSNSSNNSNYSNNNNYNSDHNDSNNSGNISNNDSGNSSYKSNQLTDSSDETEDKNNFLDSLLGSMSKGS